MAEPYQPVAPARESGYDDAARTVSVVLAAALDDPMIDSWAGDEPLTLGCSAGGTARYSLDRRSTMKVELHGCAWTPGVPVDGTVTAADGGEGDVELAVELPFASLNRTKDGALTGTFRGRPVG